jgi:hypothetical protein
MTERTTREGSVPAKKERRGGKKPPRSVLLARAAELMDSGMKAPEIAAAMDVEVGTAKGYMWRIRQQRGTTRKFEAKRGTLEERFWFRVDKENGPIHPGLGTRCWIWKGSIANNYGRVRDTEGRFGPKHTQIRPHRVAWMLATGTVLPHHNGSKGVVVMHKCDNALCVNPDHLELGTGKENIQDCIKRGRFMTPKRIEANKNRRCGICREQGHRRQSCPKKEAA